MFYIKPSECLDFNSGRINPKNSNIHRHTAGIDDGAAQGGFDELFVFHNYRTPTDYVFSARFSTKNDERSSNIFV